MHELLATAFVTLVVVIDPVGLAPLFASLTPNASSMERRRLVLRGVSIAAGILVVFALAGRALLGVLGVGLPAFRIAGGILLLLLAVDMVMVRQSGLRATTPGEDEESGHRADISVFPLAIPLIAGPGALTSVVLLMGRAEGDWRAKVSVIAVMALVLLLTLACLLLTERIMTLLGVTGTNVVSRVAGILLSALAVQFVIDGVLQVWSL